MKILLAAFIGVGALSTAVSGCDHPDSPNAEFRAVNATQRGATVLGLGAGGGKCSGVLISSRHVLTAGHCDQEFDQAILRPTRDGAPGPVIDVESFHQPPEYKANPGVDENDLGIAVLADPAPSEYVPARLLLDDVGAFGAAIGSNVDKLGYDPATLVLDEYELQVLSFLAEDPTCRFNYFDPTGLSKDGHSGGPAYFGEEVIAVHSGWYDGPSGRVVCDVPLILYADFIRGFIGGRGACADIQPDSNHTCAEQKGWGKCDESWMVDGGYCAQTCGRCDDGSPGGGSGTCSDTSTPDGHSCADQKAWGKCDESWMVDGGYCARTCGRCDDGSPGGGSGTCGDTPTPDEHSCADQKAWGKCDESWMVDGGYCASTCGRC